MKTTREHHNRIHTRSETPVHKAGFGRWELFVALVCLGVAAARAATVTLQHGVHGYTAAADAWLDEGAKTRNYGGSSSLRVQYNNGVSDCTVLRFQLPALSFQTLTSATLGLFYYDQSSMQSDNAVWITPYRITNGMSWFENVYDGVSGYGVNWRFRDHDQTQPWSGEYAGWYDKIHDGNSTNKIKRPGGSVSDAIEPPNWVTWDVRNSVAQWYAGQENNGFVLFESGFQGGGYIAAGLFRSREFADPALRPYLQLVFAGAHIAWAGYTNGTWDTTTVNWDVGGCRGAFGNGDVVTFADGPANTDITITGSGVSPGAMIISNNTTAYRFAGGGIGGSATLTKTGGASATLAAANSYAGPTLVQAGRLIVTADGALGSAAGGTVVSNGAALHLQGVTYGTAEPLLIHGAGPSGGGALCVESGVCSFSGPITLGASSSIGVPAGAALTLDSAISGSGDLTKAGSGTLALTGAAPNTYGGATLVNAGTLLLGKSAGSAVPGTLLVGDGIQPATVRLQNHGQLHPAASVAIAAGSTLDLNSFNSAIASLSLSNASVLTGDGTLAVAGDIHSHGDRTNLISGRLDLSGGVRSVSVADGAAWDDLLLSATVGSGGILKIGSGRLVLAGANNCDREILVGAGILSVANDAALGKTSAPTIVSNDARLELRGNVALGLEPLRLNGSGQGWGALFGADGNASCAGTVWLDSDATVGVAPGAALSLQGVLETAGHALTFNAAGSLTVNGPIRGDGATVTKIGAGNLTFGGADPNTYSGPTRVNEGALVLAKATGPAIPGWLEVGGWLASATVRCDADGQFNFDTVATVRENGLLDLNGHRGTLAGLTLMGGRVETGDGQLDLLGPLDARGDADSWLLGRLWLAPDTRIQADGPGTLYLGAQILAGSFAKWGAGRLVLTNANLLTNDSLVASGEVLVNNDPARGFGLGPGGVVVETAPVLGGWEASLGGTGSLSGPVTVRNYGVLNPGASVGTLFVSNNVTFGPNGWLALDTDGSHVDVLDLLQGGDLEIQPGAGLRLLGPLTGERPYVFVKRARSVQGTFEGWPEGQPVPDQPGWFIHYGTQRIYFSRVEQPLVYFRAFATNGVVVVAWRTAIEIETTGFDLFRWEEGEGWVRVNVEPIPAQGPNGAAYAVVDTGATTDFTYRYRLDEYASGGVEQREFLRTPTEFAFTVPPRAVAEGVELRWRSRMDEAYDVLGTVDLNEPFSVWIERVPATPPENLLIVPTNAPTQFFRLRLAD